jgi:hypothetical protein
VGWLRRDPANKFAIKSMKKHEIIQSKHVDHIENEKNILDKLDHPFSVRFPSPPRSLPTLPAVELQWLLPRRTIHLLRD